MQACGRSEEEEKMINYLNYDLFDFMMDYESNFQKTSEISNII